MWEENPNPLLVKSGIILLQSTDPINGWSTATEIAVDPLHRYTNPVLHPYGTDGLALAYQSYELQTIRPGPDSDVIVRTSGNAGGTWSAPKIANTDHATDFPWITDQKAQLVSGDHGVVVAVWAANTDHHYTMDHVMFARSEDYGATWSNTAPITPSYEVGLTVFHDHHLVYAGQGRWILKYMYGPFNQKISYYSISEDNGFSWSEPLELNGKFLAGNGNGTVVKYVGKSTSAGTHAVSRLPRNSLAWEDAFLPASELSGDSAGMIVNTSGQNWFITTKPASNVVYTSTDDGRTWTANAGTNVPDRASRFDVDEDGKVVAIYAQAITYPSIIYKIYVSRSTDNGVTWTTPELLGNGTYSSESLVGDFVFGDISSIGNDTWIIAWQNSEYSISTDGGITWSSRIAVPFEGMDTFSLPSITGDNGRFTIAWQQNQSDGSTILDLDIYYSFGTYGAPAAADDWQLFE